MCPLHLEYFFIFLAPLPDTNSLYFMALDSRKIRPSPVPHGRTLPPVTCHLSSKCHLLAYPPLRPKVTMLFLYSPLVNAQFFIVGIVMDSLVGSFRCPSHKCFRNQHYLSPHFPDPNTQKSVWLFYLLKSFEAFIKHNVTFLLVKS